MSTLPITPATPFESSVLHALQAELEGEMLTPEHPHYETARRIWNGHIDRRPALIVRCRAARDAALAVEFARRHQLPLAVRGGGHNTAGLAVAEGGLMLDLSPLKGLQIDPARRVVRAESGLTLGEFVPALAAHGLVTTTGTCAGTGLGGSTLGGGIGWLAGKYGMAIDNVLAFELVTADGRLRRASADEYPDLFWALRGGGGNFGVVTAIEYRAHVLGQVLGGMLVYPLGEAAGLLRRYCELLATAPDELGALAILTTLPGAGPVLMIQLCYAGVDLARGVALITPLRAAAQPLLDTITPMAYGDFFMAYTPPVPDGRCYYDSACALAEPLSEEAIQALIASAERFSSPLSSIVLHNLRGAAARVAPTATAFALRTAHQMVVYAAGWEQGDGAGHINWAEQALSAMRPFADEGLYVNFMNVATESEVRAAYAANYARLIALKAEYDPHNLFRLNQNIPPARDRRGL